MVSLGWLSLPIMFPLANRAGFAAVVLMAVGGILYTVGMLFKVTRWPRLWPRVFSAHELFHVFVVAASAFHWMISMGFPSRSAITKAMQLGNSTGALRQATPSLWRAP